MYYHYYDNEEAFLSVYSAAKLLKGGEPVITQEELQIALKKFLKSFYYSNNLSKIKSFKFDDLQEMAKNFQKRASENRPWLKPCFVFENDKLYPTYNFFDFTNTTYGEFLGFLCDERYNKFVTQTISEGILKSDETVKKAAKLAARYITEYFAAKYIEKEEKRGRWPNHLTDISCIFKDDLGRALKLKGTKDYFTEFNGHVYSMLGSMLKANDGKLILTDKEKGALDYNNLKRILVAHPTFDELCSPYYSEERHPKKFDMVIDKSSVKVNEQELVYSDPYGDFSDEFANKEINLNK